MLVLVSYHSLDPRSRRTFEKIAFNKVVTVLAFRSLERGIIQNS